MNCKEIINSKFPVDAGFVCSITYMTIAMFRGKIKNTSFMFKYQ
jgi:hypothetical protein